MAEQAESSEEQQRLSPKEELASLSEQIASQAAKTSPPHSRPIRIADEIARERKLKNDDTEQDIKLKKLTLKILFGFLALETVAIFAYAFFQATRSFSFHLEEWSFKLLVSATITQITVMLYVAVRYLFPKKRTS